MSDELIEQVLKRSNQEKFQTVNWFLCNSKSTYTTCWPCKTAPPMRQCRELKSNERQKNMVIKTPGGQLTNRYSRKDLVQYLYHLATRSNWSRRRGCQVCGSYFYYSNIIPLVARRQTTRCRTHSDHADGEERGADRCAPNEHGLAAAP